MTTGREVEERRKMFRRWCLRHPFRTIWRAWLWWRYDRTGCVSRRLWAWLRGRR